MYCVYMCKEWKKIRFFYKCKKDVELFNLFDFVVKNDGFSSIAERLYICHIVCFEFYFFKDDTWK